MFALKTVLYNGKREKKINDINIGWKLINDRHAVRYKFWQQVYILWCLLKGILMLLRDKTERHALKGDRKPPWKGQNNKSTNVCDMNSGVSDVHCVTHLLHPQRRDHA